MRPLSVGEILDASFSAFRRNFGQLVLAMLVIVVPLALLQSAVLASIDDYDADSLFDTSMSEDETVSGGQVAGILVLGVLSLLTGILAPAVVLRLIGADVAGQPVRAAESLRYSLRRLPGLLWVAVLVTLSVIVGLILCILPGIWIGVLLSMAMPAAIYEDLRGTDALSRSNELIKEHWWRTFGTLIVMALITLVIQNVIGLALLGSLADSDNEVLGLVLSTVVTVVSYALTLPLVGAALAYVYFDLRVRKEGFDLQLLANEIGTPAPAVEGLPPLEDPPAGGGFLPPRPPGA